MIGSAAVVTASAVTAPGVYVPTDLVLLYAAAYALGAMLCGIAIWLGLEKSSEHPALYRFGPAFVIAVALPVVNVLGALAFLVYLAWCSGWGEGAA